MFLGVFRARRYEEVSLAQWLARIPPALVMQHFNLPAEVVARPPKEPRGIVPV